MHVDGLPANLSQDGSIEITVERDSFKQGFTNNNAQYFQILTCEILQQILIPFNFIGSFISITEL